MVESTAYDFYGPLNEDTVLFSEDRTPLGKVSSVVVVDLYVYGTVQ